MCWKTMAYIFLEGMENEQKSYRRITLKLSEDAYGILLEKAKEKKREIIIQESLYLYNQTKHIQSALLNMLHIVKYIKIAIEYMNFNLFVEEKNDNDPYKQNYQKAIDLLTELEAHLQNLSLSFFEK